MHVPQVAKSFHRTIPPLFVLEKDSSVDPISLAKCTGDLLLNLGDVEGWKELFEDKRSRKSERTLTSCMHGDDHGME